MIDYKNKYNLVYRLQKWMDSVPGQTFLNYAYSWGASIVILGTLFKLTHLPGANIMLFIGMGTEVLVFFISAFDRPFDKTDDGKVLPTHVTEEYLETGDVTYSKEYGSSVSSGTVAAKPATVASAAAQASMEHVRSEASATAEEVARKVVPTADEIAAAVKQQSEIINSAQQSTPEMVEAQDKYVEALQSLTEMLGKVSAQSERLTRDSEEMENLNRTLTGIAKIYEIQLKGASQQVGTIDQINAQTRRMAEQIEHLNQIYTRMIEAMTVNMHVAAPTPQPQPYQQAYQPQYQPPQPQYRQPQQDDEKEQAQ